MSRRRTAAAPFIINASQALPPYRSKEGEIGYKLRVRRINFSTALFRVDAAVCKLRHGRGESGLRSSVRHRRIARRIRSPATSSTTVSKR